MSRLHSRDFLKDLVSHISQIEKRYGRSIVSIRRQEEIWLEMLENEEILLPERIVSSFPDNNIWSLNGVLAGGEGFASVFDLAKNLAALSREGMSLGIDASPYNLSKKDWISFFTLVNAAVEDTGVLSVSMHIENASIFDFLHAANSSDSEMRISFILSPEFLDALQEKGEYSLFSGGLHKGKKISAVSVINSISALARKGIKVFFVFPQYADEINPLPHIGEMSVLCPSGPFLGFANESFPSIGLNLLKMLKINGLNRELDWERIADRVSHAVRMLDNMIDLDNYPLRDAFSLTKRLRRIFIGVKNWAEALFYLGIPYASDAAIELGAKVSKFIAREAEQASWDLAKERGVFSMYRGSRLEEKGIRRRNISVYGVFEDGIAPMKSLVDHDGALYPLLDEISKQRGFFDEALKRFAEENGSIYEMEGLPEDVRRVFVTGRDVSSMWKIKMLSAFQQASHNLSSIHIRFADADVENMTNIVLQSALMGCGCVSVSSALEVRQDFSEEMQSSVSKQIFPERISVRTRPQALSGTTVKIEIACGELFITINKDRGAEPVEVIMSLSKASPCISAHLESLSKMVSLALAGGVCVSDIVKQLKGISCPVSSFKGGRKITSCADALSYVLEEMFPPGNTSSIQEEQDPVIKGIFNEN